jgi:GNAT superfamily N-acetyltransferase
MQRLLMEARSRGSDWSHVHIGEATFRSFMILCHLDPQTHIRLWQTAAGEPVAYAILGDDPLFDVQVAPQAQWTGIEEEALAWAETTLAGLRQSDPERWSGDLVAFARQDDGKRRVFLGQHGFRYSGEFAEVNMLRTLSAPIPEPVTAPGYQLRALSGIEEAPARAAAYREVWLPWTDGDISDEQYVAFMQLPAYQRDLDIVAIAPDGAIAAFVTGWVDPLNRIGELGSVGVVPAHRRQGLMRAVLFEVLRRMQAQGVARACVSTGFTNIPAIRLYSAVGFESSNVTLDYRKPA